MGKVLRRSTTVALALVKATTLVFLFMAPLISAIHLGYRLKWNALYQLDSPKETTMWFGGDLSYFIADGGFIIVPSHRPPRWIPKWLEYERLSLDAIKTSKDFARWDLLKDVLDDVEESVVLDLSYSSIDDRQLSALLSSRPEIGGLILVSCENLSQRSMEAIVKLPRLSTLITPSSWDLSGEELEKAPDSLQIFQSK